MIGHERIDSVTPLRKQGLWGAVDLEGGHGVVVAGDVSTIGRTGQQSFDTRVYRLFRGEPYTINFANGSEEPDGENIRTYRLSGPDVRTRPTFSYLEKLIEVKYQMEPDGRTGSFRCTQQEVPIDELPPGCLNGNFRAFQGDMVAQTAGTYLDMLDSNSRIAKAYGAGIGGLVAQVVEI